jgi:hypothetical protein
VHRCPQRCTNKPLQLLCVHGEIHNSLPRLSFMSPALHLLLGQLCIGVAFGLM